MIVFAAAAFAAGIYIWPFVGLGMVVAADVVAITEFAIAANTARVSAACFALIGIAAVGFVEIAAAVSGYFVGIETVASALIESCSNFDIAEVERIVLAANSAGAEIGFDAVVPGQFAVHSAAEIVAAVVID